MLTAEELRAIAAANNIGLPMGLSEAELIGIISEAGLMPDNDGDDPDTKEDADSNGKTEDGDNDSGSDDNNSDEADKSDSSDESEDSVGDSGGAEGDDPELLPDDAPDEEEGDLDEDREEIVHFNRATQKVQDMPDDELLTELRGHTYSEIVSSSRIVQKHLSVPDDHGMSRAQLEEVLMKARVYHGLKKGEALEAEIIYWEVRKRLVASEE